MGDSFNDVSMLTAAERGILIYPSEKALGLGLRVEGLEFRVGRESGNDVRHPHLPLRKSRPRSQLVGSGFAA